jgi:hypothetical protein
MAALGTAFALLGVVSWILVAVSRVPDFAWNENVFLFWPADLLWAAAGAVRLVKGPAGRETLRRLCRSYAFARLTVLALYGVLKSALLFPQDNWHLIVIAGAVTAGMALVTGRRGPVRPG